MPKSQAIRQKQFNFLLWTILLPVVALNTNGAFVFVWCVCVRVVRLCSCGVCGGVWCVCVKRLRK
jgi:hypothetical protein